MGAVILSHDTALAYWSRRGATVPQRCLPPGKAQESLESTEGASALKVLDCLRRHPLAACLPRRLDALVSNESECRHTGKTLLHLRRAPMPERSLVRTGIRLQHEGTEAEVLVCSPEYVLTQMACLVELAELLELCYELCGGFAVNPSAPHGMVKRNPVSSPQRIKAFLEGADGLHGVTRMRKVSRYVLPGSLSPKESQLAILSVLKRQYGGMALPQSPLLNHAIELPEQAQKVMGGPRCVPDLYWPSVKTVIEYDSDEHHGDWLAVNHDARKRSVYQMLGLSVISLTCEQFDSYVALMAIMDNLARRFGRVRRTTPEQEAARLELHRFFVRGKRRERFGCPDNAC